MSDPVRFSQPPIVEVACGVLFNPVGLKTVHIGQLWERFKSEFPRVEEVAPINQIIEPPVFGPEQASFSFQPMPELRRNWFLDSEGIHLVQVQEDRFLFNWKRQPGTGDYPSYVTVIKKFEAYLSRFTDFLKDSQLGDILYRQYELTYVNIIGDKNGLNLTNYGGVLVDHLRNDSFKRFLPEPERFAWSTSYLLPENFGRLHVVAKSAIMNTTKENVLRLEFIARGLPSDNSEANRQKWFNVAHEWITHGFADSTTEKLHKLWERQS